MGLLWGAIVAFLVEGRLLHAAAFSAAAFVLSLLGLIHAPTIGLAPTPITWSYLIVTGLLVALGLPAALSERAAARRGVVAQATLAAPQSSPDCSCFLFAELLSLELDPARQAILRRQAASTFPPSIRGRLLSLHAGRNQDREPYVEGAGDDERDRS